MKKDKYWSMRVSVRELIKGRVGDSAGFRIGKRHFTMVKDTGYSTEFELTKLPK